MEEEEFAQKSRFVPLNSLHIYLSGESMSTPVKHRSDPFNWSLMLMFESDILFVVGRK